MARYSLSSPALSLSLAGIFGDGGSAERGSGSGGGVSLKEEALETIYSENSGLGKSRSEDDCEIVAEGERRSIDQIEDDDDENSFENRKRKRYHRHTPEQIRVMEALFKECPHPDEKQRVQLSNKLGLNPRQVKFWFQNRRTQIKAIQERHENSILKTEIEKLREENQAMREVIKGATCLSCGVATSNDDSMTNNADHEHKLRIENARLKAEVEKLRTIVENHPPGLSPKASSHSSGTELESKSSLDFHAGSFGLEKTRILDAANRAMDELHKMATHKERLWIKSYETGREILNYDEYMKECLGNHNTSVMQAKKSIEASRESAIIFVDLPWLIQSFMDANQWKELFPCLVSKAATLDFICNGDGPNKHGAAQLMFAEIQMLTPLVPSREVYFVRYCKQLSANQWGIVDVSVDKVDDNIDASLSKCRKRPSGCIIEDKSNGHCKVTWVEHLECQKNTVHSLYRTIVTSGLAFGAEHWISTLQQQCERLVFFVATNIPNNDSSGVSTLVARKSILKLAQRMTCNFSRAVGASSHNSWSKITGKTGAEVRVASRKNLNDPGEPLGTILSAVSCVWFPVSHKVLFDFLRDENRRKEWDIMSIGFTMKSVVNLAKGQDHGNAVTAMATTTADNAHSSWMLQDSSTNAFQSMVVYSCVDSNGMQSVMSGCDSSNITVLPSGFSILPDGLESRPSVISSSAEGGAGRGSLLTTAFQVLISNSPTAKLDLDSMESVNALISCTVENIRRCLQCDD
ncbi:homeobox-leucine zipper protein GLABRA 2-like [Andrographis paniculata]|uniref:homeobox-leucine zipper protein GLABRA 2-like n=1 Tax=Andrographis paniculata TaxID=175694 RepID=UPI0021E7E87F|nr:homeobox-leucine zipper protein GLABRA 2-like [Andrographis paniculata]